MQVEAPRLHNGQYAWWLVGDTGTRSMPAHDVCTHRKYRMTCAQYERLVDRAAGACELCADPGHLVTKRLNKGAWPGRLYLDHDHNLGVWAVRGLLCARCNSAIEEPENANLLAMYSAKAFYRSVLAERDAASLMWTEPDLGDAVLDYADRRWLRTTDGWIPRHKFSAPAKFALTWAEMVALSGPHNLHAA